MVSSRRLSRSSGFTLLELLLVVAMVAILASIAVPSYRQIVAKKAVEQASAQLRDHMELARTYAQTHQTKVTICPVAANQLNQNGVAPECMGLVANWPAWVVKTQEGQVLISSVHLPEGVTISAGGRDKFEFNERGGANGYHGTVGIQGVENIAQSLTIASDGRIQLDDELVRKGATLITQPSNEGAASSISSQ